MIVYRVSRPVGIHMTLFDGSEQIVLNILLRSRWTIVYIRSISNNEVFKNMAIFVRCMITSTVAGLDQYLLLVDWKNLALFQTAIMQEMWLNA